MKTTIVVAIAAALLLAPVTARAQSAEGNFITVQPPGQWLATHFIGAAVLNEAGETVGDINDLLLDKTGRIVNVVLGVGGFLGVGEKNVAVPYAALQITVDASSRRVIKIALSKAELQAAPVFKATEKIIYMRAN